MRAATITILILVLSVGGAFAADLPDDHVTPGAINPAVTQGNIEQTICRRGWSRTVRPPARYTENIKRRLLYSPSSPYYDPRSRLREYELDHRVPIGVGGNPRDPRNIWDEPRFGTWNADRKDELEDAIHELVCRHQLSLQEGQAVFLGDWREGYWKYVERR